MIQENLKKLGFSTKEVNIYLTILENGKISPANIADITKINRSTVYSIAKQLAKLGLISEDIGGSQRYFVAKPPEQLEKIVETEEYKLQRTKAAASRAIKELQSIAKTEQYHVPRIVFVDEEQLSNHLYKEANKWSESMSQYDSIWWGFQDHTLVEHYGDWIDWYWTECAPEHVSLKLLSNQSDIEKEMKKKKFTRRKIKFWENIDQFTGTIWINGDYIISVYTDKKPHYLIEQHDKVMAHNLRELFKGLWSDLEKKK